MWIRRTRGWEIPEREITPEALVLNRRALMAGAVAAAALPATARAEGLLGGLFGGGTKAAPEAPDPTADLYPARRNPAFTVTDRPDTPLKVAGSYNNFYEFGFSKRIADDAQALPTRPWTIAVDGLVEAPQTIDIDALIRSMPLEERVYRLRCVEAWSMVIPWTGFPVSALLKKVKPLSSAKYVRFETFLDAKVAPGQKQSWYPWPYVEGLTLAEANNDLAFLATGAYGQPLKKQFGAPLRLVVPWKYGFKSIKSITKITLTDQRPVGYWEALQASEYGFWANVNPEVPHPRWSQADEQLVTTGERVPTLLFNGYGAEVAGLYAGMKGEKLYM
ncbi:protein-methionine-sulfoxide reductase catalytic subunit MsrP [Segnochrobactraceae bacterium EtOH-i3]